MNECTWFYHIMRKNKMQMVRENNIIVNFSLELF